MENDWSSADTAPRDGTMVMVKGYIDITKKDKLIVIPARWNPLHKLWTTRKGQVIFPQLWKPIS